ncbi:MAG TPA: VTT domain-containing protein [Roseiflexaceae bacterium]|nr:VTT domain-containing protein [Roseiflexaceae bacterium]
MHNLVDHRTTDEPATVPLSDDHPAPRQAPSWGALAMLAGTLLLTVGLLFVPRTLIQQLGDYGYLGVFLLTLLASASVFLPSPALGVAALAGATLNPWLVGLVGGVAAGLGETTGYLAGRSGGALAGRSRFYPRVAEWVRRWGVLTVFVLAFVPGPVLDLAGIAAGTMGMPFRRFLSACLVGKVLRFIVVAWLGRLLL